MKKSARPGSFRSVIVQSIDIVETGTVVRSGLLSPPRERGPDLTRPTRPRDRGQHFYNMWLFDGRMRLRLRIF